MSLSTLFSKSEIEQNLLDFLQEHQNGLVSIIGPTASGKTAYTVELAHAIEEKTTRKAEVIVIDSWQVYKDCDISSAKIEAEEMEGVPHWGLDLKTLEEEFSVYKFQRYAFEKIREIQSRGHIPILSGGTMLWTDSITENYVFSEDKISDEDFAKSNQKAEPLWPCFKIGIKWDRAKLYDRINQRAILQFEGGLIEETKANLEKYDITKSAFTSFGYREIQAYLKGEQTYEEALANNQQRNRKYAKRQLTWWRGREDINWVDGGAL